MNKKMIRQVMFFVAGMVTIIFVPAIGTPLGELLKKPLTYGD